MHPSMIEHLKWIVHMAEIQKRGKGDTVSVWSAVGLSETEDTTGLFTVTGNNSVKMHATIEEFKKVISMMEDL